jgi:hypothetical protein
MTSPDRRYLRGIAIASVAVYMVTAAVLATLKATTRLPGAMPWLEVVFGPAITVGCTALLIYLGAWVECWVRDLWGLARKAGWLGFACEPRSDDQRPGRKP